MKDTAKLLNQKCEYPSKNLPLINLLCPFSCPAQPLLFPDIPQWHPVFWSCSCLGFRRPDRTAHWPGARGTRGLGRRLTGHQCDPWWALCPLSHWFLSMGAAWTTAPGAAGRLSGGTAGLAPRSAHPFHLRFLCPLPMVLCLCSGF